MASMVKKCSIRFRLVTKTNYRGGSGYKQYVLTFGLGFGGNCWLRSVLHFVSTGGAHSSRSAVVKSGAPNTPLLEVIPYTLGEHPTQ